MGHYDEVGSASPSSFSRSSTSRVGLRPARCDELLPLVRRQPDAADTAQCIRTDRVSTTGELTKHKACIRTASCFNDRRVHKTQSLHPIGTRSNDRRIDEAQSMHPSGCCFNKHCSISMTDVGLHNKCNERMQRIQFIAGRVRAKSVSTSLSYKRTKEAEAFHTCCWASSECVGTEAAAGLSPHREQ